MARRSQGHGSHWLYSSTALKGSRNFALASLLCASLYAAPAWAGPEDGVVSGGSASITQSGLTTDIHQFSNRTVIDWRTFNVGASESVRFFQPSSGAVALNRVQAGNPSQIDGQITANGNVIIVNPNGVFFGAGSRVDVNSLVVTSAGIDTNVFMAGGNDFDIAGAVDAKIVNNGQITAKDAGLVGLVAPQVENNGTIVARVGKVQAASGDNFTLDLYGDGLISVRATGALEKQIVKNTGSISATGGQIQLTAAIARDNIDNLVSNSGTLEANSIGVKNGRITLSADGGTIQNTGSIHAKGNSTDNGGRIDIAGAFVALGGDINADGRNGGTITVDAQTLSLADSLSARGIDGLGGSILLQSGTTWETSTSSVNVDGSAAGGVIRHIAGLQLISSGSYSAQSSQGNGGSIDISARSTKFLTATINANGYTGGGTVRLGGEYQGGKDLPTDDLPNAQYLVMDRGTRIEVRALSRHGKGGTTILWSDLETVALGTITATPGTDTGDGGFAEISSGGTLNYDATVQTGTGSRAGSVLLDPKNIVISDFSFNSTALIMGYGYGGGGNTETNLEVNDSFGASVALNGTRMAVGALYDDGFDNSISNAGAVYLYSFADMNFNGGVLEAVIGAGYVGGKNIDMSAYLETNDYFGSAVALDGKQLAIGAMGDNGLANVAGDSGAVYLYTFSDNVFSDGALTKIIGRNYDLNMTVLGTSDYFGSAVSLDGNRLAVGAMYDDGAGNAMANAGSVYLFSFDDDLFSNITLASTIGYGYSGGKNYGIAELEANDYFGTSVSLDGRTLAIGASYDDGAGNILTNSGAVYLVNFSDMAFSDPALISRIGAGYSGPADINVSNIDNVSDYFGYSVSLDNNRLAVGAYGDDGFMNRGSNNGAVYLFSFDDPAYTNLRQEGIIGLFYAHDKNVDLYGRGLGSTDYLGYSVALDGNRLASGALGDDGQLNNASASGAVHLFSFDDAAFTNGKIEGSVGAGYTEGRNINVTSLTDADSYFATSVAIDGRKIAIGDINNDGFNNKRAQSGAVYLYNFTDDEFSGGILQGIIGDGYTGGNNYNQQLAIGSLMGSGLSMDGNRLAVGVAGDTGSGGVYIYTFDDGNFSNIQLASRIGRGYTGAKDLDMTPYLSSDGFGYAVSLDGTKLAVGAYADDGNANILQNTGAVYLFTFADLAFSTPTLQGIIGRGYNGAKDIDLTALDINDYFGYSVSLDGNRLAVGAYANDGFGDVRRDSGAVYLFTFADATFSGGQNVAIIGDGYTGGKNINVTLGVDEYLGSSVALSGTNLFVGAMYDDGFGNYQSNSGAVHRFSFTDLAFSGGTLASSIGGRYTGAGSLDLRGTLGASDYFGRSIAVDGKNLIVGAHYDDGYGNNAPDSGAAYLIHFDDLTYQKASLKGVIGAGYGNAYMEKSVYVPEVADNDYFGSAVSLDGNRLAIGAYGDDGFNDAASNAGAVYLYTFTDSAFSGAKLEGIVGHGYTGGKNINVSSYLEAGDSFGYSVSLDGQMMAVGAINDDGLGNVRSNAGAVYLFNFSDMAFTGGTMKGIIGDGYTGGNNISLTLRASDFFGTGVSLDSNRLAIGAYGDDGAADARNASGSVYLYTFADGNYAGGQLRHIIGYNQSIAVALDTSDSFGQSVSLDGNRLAIGAAGDDGNGNALSNAGAVYLYSFTNAATFAGAALEAKIGAGYTGGKNLDITSYLDVNDAFGSSVSLSGTRLAAGSLTDDGYNNLSQDSGAIYMFTANDLAFNSLTTAGVVGQRYTSGKSVDLYDVFLQPQSDQFSMVSIDGNRMVIGSVYDDTDATNVGSVSLITFADSAFTSGTVRGVMGAGYSRGMYIDSLSRSANEQFGFALSLNQDRMAVGMPYNDGFNDSRSNSGGVYLYSTGNNFSSIILEGIIGNKYTGGKNIDVSSYLEQGDNFGYSVSLDGKNIAVGTPNDDGAINNFTNGGAVYLFSFDDNDFNGGELKSIIGYGYSQPGSLDLNSVTPMNTSDTFGYSVSLDGQRLAVGAANEDGNLNAVSAAGSVYLFSFSDDVFTAPTLQARIGYGYSTGKDYNLSNLETSDYFGTSVSLDGRRLAVGAYGDNGYLNDIDNPGAVYMFTFADDLFGGLSHVGTIGNSYTGAGDYDLSLLGYRNYFGQSVSLQNTTLVVGASGKNAAFIFTFPDLSMNDAFHDSSIGSGYTGGKNINIAATGSFGNAVSYDGGMLVIGAPVSAGFNGNYANTGSVYLFRSSLSSPNEGYSFTNLPSSTIGITAGSLANLLSTPQNVTLQASNNITVSSALLVDNSAGNGGTLTLQAGNSIYINAVIDTDNGHIYLLANEDVADGVVSSQRDAGAATVNMGVNGRINAGTGNVFIVMDNGAGLTNATAGDIVLNTINANNISVISENQTGSIILNGVLTASGTNDAILLASAGDFTNNAGAGALVANNGRWLVYSDHQDLNTLNGLTSDFSINRCLYGGACSAAIPGTGNGLLYQYGQILLQVSVDTTRAYGDANPDNATLQTLYTYDGFINGDDASDLDVLPTATVSLAGNAGAGTVGTITLTGGSDDLYDYYLVGGTITVTKRDITATWNGTLSKTYGSLNPTVNTTDFTYTNLAFGQNNGSITASADFTGIDGTTAAGDYTIGAVFTANNYNVINAPTTTLTINKRNITASWNGALTKTYGDANPGVSTSNFTYTGFVNGDTDTAVTASGNFGAVTAQTDVGVYTVGGVFSSQNYNVTNAPTTNLTIGKRNITAVVNDTSRAYGDANPSLNWSNVTWSNLAPHDNGSGIDTVTLTMPTATATSNAGTTHAINLAVTDGNYTLTGYTPGTLTIDKRNITAAWNSPLTKTYGDSNPAVSTSNFTYTGLVNGDTNAVVTATADYGTVDANTDHGTYNVGAGFAASNYTVTNAPVTTLTIGKRALTVATDAKSKTYGDADPAFTGTVTGLTAHDAALISWLYGPDSYAGNAGTYIISATATDASNRLANYTRTNNYNNLTVAKRDITAAVNSKSITYGDAYAGSWSDAVWSNMAYGQTGSVLDTVTLSAPTANVFSNAGTTHAIQLAVTDNNYNLTGYTNGTLTVDKAPLVIKANDASRADNAANPAFSVSYTGLRNNDDPALAVTGLTITSTASGTSPVGRYAITPANGSASNYQITYIDGYLDIFKNNTNALPNTVRKAPETVAQSNTVTGSELVIGAINNAAASQGGPSNIYIDKSLVTYFNLESELQKAFKLVLLQDAE